jgi:apolipoprotein N-acyltransferase
LSVSTCLVILPRANRGSEKKKTGTFASLLLRTRQPMHHVIHLRSPRRIAPAWIALAGGGVIGSGCNVPALWPLVLVALPLLCVAVVDAAREGVRAGAWTVAAAATGWHAAAMWWVVDTVRAEGAAAPVWRALVLVGLVAIQLGWWLAMWLPLQWAARRMTARRELSAAQAGVTWWLALVAADTLRQLGPMGDGYAGLAVALVDAPGVAGWLPVLGAQGVAAIVLALATWVAVRWLDDGRLRQATARRVALPTAMLVSVAAAGMLASARLEWTEAQTAPAFFVAVQPDFDKSARWTLQRRDESIAMIENAMRIAPRGAVVVTPETFLGESPPAEPQGRWAELLQQVRERDVHLLVGMPHHARDDDGMHLMNAVVQLAPQRQSLYAKERLVPGGEYLPFPHTFGFAYRRMFDHVTEGQMSAPPALTGPLYAAGVAIGVSICHEQAFALTMAERARDATVLANVSEDSWIPVAAYRLQMLSTARLRAMEFAKPLLRVTNGGRSVLIDAHGGLVAAATDGSRQLVPVRVVPREGRTPYQRAAPFIAFVPVLAWLLALFAGVWRVRPAVPFWRETSA